MKNTTVIGPIVLAAIVSLAACEKREEKSEELYFRDLRIPVGITAEIFSDVNSNTETNSSITIITVVPTDLDRDELDILMQSFIVKLLTV
ncbi:MAG: hypothetical protein V1754_09965 [Pseudomonadota bacterium]